MTKSIASYPIEQQPAVIRRRLTSKTQGSGYWAAVRAAETLGLPVPSQGRPPRQPREHDELGEKHPLKKFDRALKRRPVRRDSGNRMRLA